MSPRYEHWCNTEISTLYKICQPMAYPPTRLELLLSSAEYKLNECETLQCT